MCLETFCREQMTHGQSLLHTIFVKAYEAATHGAPTTPCEPEGFGRSRNDFLRKFGMLTKSTTPPSTG
jgi:hypothetical protein